MRFPRFLTPPHPTGKPLGDDERWDLFDLPDVDEILYRSWEELVLHRIQHLAGVVFGLAAVLSPWWWLAFVAVVLYVVIDLAADLIDIRSRRWIYRTPMDAEYCQRWLRTDRAVGAYGLAAMIVIIMVRFA